MALQIAALNDESFIFVIFTNPSAFPLWDLSRTGGACYPLSRTDHNQARRDVKLSLVTNPVEVATGGRYFRGCNEPRRWHRGTTEIWAQLPMRCPTPMRAKDLEWTRFHGLFDSSCAANRDAGTYIATSRAMRMAT
jgi:hypothetical protein